MIIADKSW